MAIRFRSRQFGRKFRLASLLFGIVLLIWSSTSSWALAQSTDDSWTEPLNLSHSGVAKAPSFVVDSQGVGHVVWRDDLAKYLYTRFEGNQWSAPETTDLDLLFSVPIAGEDADTAQVGIYTGPNPLLIAGPGQYIFAFWISPQGVLFTSKVKNQNFDDLFAWDTRRLISLDAASFAAAVDARGGLHLAYVRTVDDPRNPAGIYYTRSKSNGSSWTEPVLLYESPYFRRLGEGEANLSLATTAEEDTVHVHIAWDNRPRKQVLLVQSTDSGQSWEKPALVAGPELSSGLASPFNIQVGANQNRVVLVWQSGQATSGLLPSCSQIYQFSNDAGDTWSDPQTMVQDQWGCARSNEFVRGLANSPEDPLYLLSEANNQVFLTAWDGLQWSLPQAQPVLSGFKEPEIYTEVIYGCRRASLLGDQLFIVGCDQGGGGDVWVTSRDLSAGAPLFERPIWSQLLPVATDSLQIEAVKLVATGDDLIHAFFSQRQDPVVYYTFWDGKSWSLITPVFELPEGETAWPAIAAGPENELFLIAPNNKGALYFSRAISGKAATESSWSTPARLEIGQDGKIGSVDVGFDTAGTVYVAYSVPVNDERGIYIVQSKDRGTTWSEPLQVFNGAAADFDMVGSPSLLISDNGFLHIIWNQQSIQGDGVPQPLSLFYTRSEDRGHTFSGAELVVEESVVWQKIMADHKGNLHLLWQPQDMMTTVWDQLSSDGGQSWQFPQGLPNEGKIAVLVDSVGRLHLVDAGLDSLGHWLWDGSRWQREPPLDWSLDSQKEAPVEVLAAAVNEQGKMVVVWAVPAGEDGTGGMNLLYSTRTLELPPKQTATKQVPTQTLLSPTLTPTTITPEPLLTPTASNDLQSNNQSQTDGVETSSSISPLAIALVPVALLLLGVLGIGIRRATQLKDQ